MSIRGKWKSAAFVASFCALLVSSGCTLIPKEEEVLKPPLVKPQKETYQLYEVKPGTIMKQIIGTAVFESTAVKYEQFTAVSGKISAVNVGVGNMVKKGDVLVQLDVDGLDINAKEKERDVLKAKLALQQAQQNGDTQMLNIRKLELEIAMARLDDANKQIQGKALVAEIDGVVTSVEAMKIGDIIQLSKTYVTIADPNQMRLVYSVSGGVDVSDAQVGMTVELGIKDQKLTGKVAQTPASAPKTDNKQLADKYARSIYIEPAQLPAGVGLGTSADIKITLMKKENVLVIPRSGLGTYLGRTFVKILDGESIKEIDVEKGIESQSDIEIVKGLKEGQKVILQ
ncbi:MAG: biotin/lipoyl-binding protein [Paenibacillaceae bacterium]|nr:biotin/lipoyl-binding protein [Paenibacillaceae bacterium]